MLDAAPRAAILIGRFVVSACATRRSKPAESSGAFRRRTSFVSERILSALVIDTSERSAAIGLIRKSVVLPALRKRHSKLIRLMSARERADQGGVVEGREELQSRSFLASQD